MDGWIKLHRKMTQWEWYEDTNARLLFLHLLLTANYEDKNWRGITIKRGQRLASRSTLSKEVGLSEQQTRNQLKHLQTTSELTIKSTNRYSIITVLNYNKYQPTNQPTNKQTTSQPTTTKEDKNIKEIKNIERVYNSLDYLKNIPSGDLEEFFTRVNATRPEIIDKADSLYNYCQSKGRTYKNYKAFLLNAIKRDFGIRKDTRKEVVDYGQMGGDKKIPRPI